VTLVQSLLAGWYSGRVAPRARLNPTSIPESSVASELPDIIAAEVALRTAQVEAAQAYRQRARDIRSEVSASRKSGVAELSELELYWIRAYRDIALQYAEFLDGQASLLEGRWPT
jgi:hypothetical protein